ncbi:MAG TPA: hypothetical protein VHR66_22770 [Gemmataceae bacterium]|jgi:hypothetical protein|nr:hypothetical protein [Gemmataceae bacterium]
MRVLTFLTLAVVAPFALSDEPVRLTENAASGNAYRVVSASNISGELLTPVAKDKPPERIKIAGKSSIDYIERILPVDAKEADFKSLRIYEKIEFRKTAGDRTDDMTLRPAVRRLVMMKRGPSKAPFSPDGPLMWGEIDLLRTDVIVPGLAGLLPTKEVRPGDTWKASAAAVAELTDLEKIDKGDLDCTLDRIITSGPRKIASVTFFGTLSGVNEDGPTRQKLAGRLLVDLTAQCITFLKVDGEHYLLDADGKDAGKITGTFELTRSPIADHPALADAAIKGLTLSPNAENSRLLYDTAETGVRFIHDRNWRLVRSTGRQITLDESDGAGLLITLDTADAVPTAARYQHEALKELQERGGKVIDRKPPERVAQGIDRFMIDAQVGTEKVAMVYFVIRQEKGGATLAARIPDAHREARLKELDRLARSFTVTRRLDGK